MIKIKNILKIISIFFIAFSFSKAHAVELVIGEENVKPGIVYIFEGAVKDTVDPSWKHLPENETHVHIEARANWNEDEKKIPKGGVPGGFIPYLRINAKVTNEQTGLSTFIDLAPHVNLVDNLHYARNMSLPGKITDTYTVVFTIEPPSSGDLSYHKDWVKAYGNSLTQKQKFTYKKVNFEEIAKATR